MVVNIDWFSFSVLLALSDEEKAHGISLRCPDGYQMVEYSGTNLYKNRHILYSQYGDKVLTLLTTPHSKIIKPESMFVEVANRWLYCDFSFVVTLLQQIHSYSFQSLSRLDICCDFNPSVSQWDVIEGLQDSRYYVTGKREGSMFFTIHTADNLRLKRNAHCMSWGSKSTNIKWKLYNKTLEVCEVAPNGKRYINKPYIWQMWLDNQLDPQQVWRLEVSIMGASSYKWRGEHLTWDVMQQHKFTPLYWDLTAYRFLVRANEGHKNRGHDTIMPFLDIPATDHYRLRPADPKGDRPHDDHAVSVRAAMKELERPEVKCYRRMSDAWLQVLTDTVEAGRLQQFFYNNYGMSLQQYKQQYYEINN